MDSELRNLNLKISAATIFKVLAIVILVFLLYYLKDIVLVLLTSVVIASAVGPAVRWLGRWGLPRVLAVLAVYVLAFAVIGGILFFFLPPVFQDIAGISYTIPKQIDSFIKVNPAWDTITTFSGSFSSANFSIQDIIAKGIESPLPGNVYDFIKAIFNGVVSFILIVVISFYLAVQKNGVENFLRIITPIKQEPYVLDLWRRTEIKIGRWIQGQLLLGVIIGPLVFLGLTLFRIKYALILAITAAVFELIPIFGPTLSAVPAVILGFSESVTLGLIIIGFYVIVQQFENHLIYPLVVKKIIGVNPLVVIISLIIGYELAGFIGIILAVPVATLMMEFLGDLEKRKYAE